MLLDSLVISILHCLVELNIFPGYKSRHVYSLSAYMLNTAQASQAQLVSQHYHRSSKDARRRA